MAQIINTKIVLRNDSTVNWDAHADQVLLKGELGIEFTESGKAKIKVGDGVKAWSELDYFGGETLLADGKSVKVENGEISLFGFDAAEIGAQPRKGENGIEWIIPSAVDVESLKTDVENLKTNIADIKTNVDSLQEIINPSGDGATPLLARVETLEDKVNGTGDGSIAALIDSKINNFASTVTDNGTIETFKELVDYVAGHGAEFNEVVNDITNLQELVGTKSVSDQIVEAIANSGHMMQEKALAIFDRIKYEISHKPVGTLVNYTDKEIRVMVPKDTNFTLQNSGENADPNKYYIGFKAYAPDGATGFKEDLSKTIGDDTLYSFENNEFAGTDAQGRKYSIVWLPVAKYDGSTWTYYGKGSQANKFVGWYYTVEWYNEDGLVIGTDTIRINLTNEDCHREVKPFYVPVSSSAENQITIEADNTMTINSVNVNKLVQTEGDSLIMSGGNALN